MFWNRKQEEEETDEEREARLDAHSVEVVARRKEDSRTYYESVASNLGAYLLIENISFVKVEATEQEFNYSVTMSITMPWGDICSYDVGYCPSGQVEVGYWHIRALLVKAYVELMKTNKSDLDDEAQMNEFSALEHGLEDALRRLSGNWSLDRVQV